MVKTKIYANDFEILISTMNRTSLSFLQKMFANEIFHNYNILIVNQTEPNKELVSAYQNIRVINSFDKGLSKSRNIAIENARFGLCLFADDDVEYKSGFVDIIIRTFKEIKNADIITFQMEDEKGRLFKLYPSITRHDKKSLYTVNSVVIAFRREKIINSKLCFNTNFGLGAVFPTADEYIFLRDALKSGLRIYFGKEVILRHNYNSSGRVLGSDEIIFARSALIYKYSGVLTYLKLIKYLHYAFVKKEVKVTELLSKYFVGLKGIKKYKELVKLGLEKT